MATKLENNQFKAYGRIIQIEDELEITDSYKIREMVVNVMGYSGQSETLKFTANHPIMIDRVNKFKVGDDVNLTYTIKGYEHKDKGIYYNSLVITSINK